MFTNNYGIFSPSLTLQWSHASVCMLQVQNGKDLLDMIVCSFPCLTVWKEVSKVRKVYHHLEHKLIIQEQALCNRNRNKNNVFMTYMYYQLLPCLLSLWTKKVEFQPEYEVCVLWREPLSNQSSLHRGNQTVKLDEKQSNGTCNIFLQAKVNHNSVHTTNDCSTNITGWSSTTQINYSYPIRNVKQNEQRGAMFATTFSQYELHV